MTVYLSGQITGTNDYRERFDKAYREVSRYHKAINPVDISDALDDVLPYPADYEDYMRADLDILKDCDAIYMLRGWTNSNGARREFDFAKRNGLAVYFER